MALPPLLRRYDAALLDLDGCVWVGDEATERAPEAVAALRAGGLGVAFVTNDPRATAEQHVRKLWRLGIRANAREVVTVGGALQFALAEARPGGGTAFVVGAPAVHRHVGEAGLRVVNDTDLASRADVVVLAGHDDLRYAELRTATQAAIRGADLWATSRDRTFPMPDGPWPGTGAVVAAVEHACERRARIVGKPQAAIFRAAADRAGGAHPLVIGDRPDTDLAGAGAAGFDAALVLTGGAEPTAPPGRGDEPVAIAASLAELVLGPA